MANTPDYSWPPMEKRKMIGQRFKRLDGPVKSTGRAKYSSDTRPKDLLFGAYLTNPHAHARVTSIDTSEAEKLPGVTRAERRGEAVVLASSDSDASLRKLLEEFPEARDIEVRGAGLEEAFLQLTGDVEEVAA